MRCYFFKEKNNLCSIYSCIISMNAHRKGSVGVLPAVYFPVCPLPQLTVFSNLTFCFLVQDLLLDQTIEKVSFCAPDRNFDRAFSYICRDGTTRRWICHCFMAVKDTVSIEKTITTSINLLLLLLLNICNVLK